MKKILTVLVPWVIGACSSTAPQSPMPSAPPTVVDPYPGKAVCFLLIDAQTGQIQKSLYEENCKIRMPACSTFKVPLAIMAFDSGLLKSERTTMKWNGQKNSMQAWNKDQTAASWMQNSTVWYSQNITQKMGFEKLRSYLRKFDYGSQDLTGGIKTAWLTPATAEDKGYTLQISAFEQTDFLKKLLYDKLPATKKAQDLTKKLIFLEKTSKGYEFSGKTGSGRTDLTQKRRIGWFVGILKTPNRDYVFAANYQDKVDVETEEFGSRFAKQLTIDLLKEEGLW